MNIIEHTLNNKKIAEIASDEIIITNLQDALDLMANISYREIYNIILYEKNITPEFFDLKTRLAGEILQKYMNYGMRLAIVGDFIKYESSSLKAFIIESNRGSQFFFVGDIEEAKEKLAGA